MFIIFADKQNNLKNINNSLSIIVPTNKELGTYIKLRGV